MVAAVLLAAAAGPAQASALVAQVPASEWSHGWYPAGPGHHGSPFAPRPIVSGEGSEAAAGVVARWRAQAPGALGRAVAYAPTGAERALADLVAGRTGYAVSETLLRAAPDAGPAAESSDRRFASVPLAGSGTALAYRLRVRGRQVDGLRLSGETVARVFTRAITWWDDPAIAADNPGVALPHTRIVPVVRSDAAGSTAQFTAWLAHEHPALWQAQCARAHRTPCAATSRFPATAGFRTRSGSAGVTAYVSDSGHDGAIAYVEAAYAGSHHLSVVRVRNAAGAYVAPTSGAMAAALAGAAVAGAAGSLGGVTADLGGVYANRDPAAYPITDLTWLIAPAQAGGRFGPRQGTALVGLARYALCDGQASLGTLGFAPLPVPLVQVGLAQLARVPGADAAAPPSCGSPEPPHGQSGDVSLTATVPVQTSATDGPLALAVPAAPATLAGSGPWAANADYELRGSLGTVSVSDQRAVSAPGWELTAHVADFAGSGGGTIGAQQLGWEPQRVGGDATTVTLGPALGAGSAGGPTAARLLAAAPAGPGSVGTTTLDAALRLVVDSGSPDNRVYSSTVTIDLISR